MTDPSKPPGEGGPPPGWWASLLRQVAAMLAEHVAHGENPLPGFRSANDIEYKPQRAEEAFVPNQAARFEQVHRRGGFGLNLEANTR